MQRHKPHLTPTLFALRSQTAVADADDSSSQGASNATANEAGLKLQTAVADVDHAVAQCDSMSSEVMGPSSSDENNKPLLPEGKQKRQMQGV